LGGKLWVAKNYPNFERIRVQLKQMEQSPAMKMAQAQGPATSDLPGMVVKSQSQAFGETITETLISAKEEPANPANYDVPEAYRVIGLHVTTSP
jgi:Tfp pilus assembly protein PilO